MQTRKKYAIVGLGGRHEMFRKSIVSDFASTSLFPEYPVMPGPKSKLKMPIEEMLT
jgi:hypothetical protein